MQDSTPMTMQRVPVLFSLLFFFVIGVRAGGDEGVRLVGGDVEEARAQEMHLYGTFGVTERVARLRYLIPYHAWIKAGCFVAGATLTGVVVAIVGASSGGAECPPCPTLLAVTGDANFSANFIS